MRINLVLKEGRAEGLPLVGEIRMRWATRMDVKKKGAAAESKFYKIYGEQAGREGRPMAALLGGNKRRRGDEGAMGSERWQMLGEMADSAEPMNAIAWTLQSLGGRRGDGRGERAQNNRHRPAVSKNDLDAELEAFVNDRPPE